MTASSPAPPSPILITHDYLLGVEARTTDPLAAALLQHAGFHRTFNIDDDSLPAELHGLHRLPYDLATYDLRRAASSAAEMLRSARFRVDLDPELYVGPTTTFTDPQGENFAGAAVLDATDLVAASESLPAACEALALVLDENDGALARLTEFFEVAAEKARAAGEPLAHLAHDFDVAAGITTQLCERLAEAADATRPTEPAHDRPLTAATRAAQHRAAARARAADAPSLARKPLPRSANHRIAAPLPRPNPTGLGGHR